MREQNKASTYFVNKKLYKDIESLQWHPKVEHNLVATTESGHIIGFDTRNFDTPLFTVAGHSKSCSAASFSPHFSNMLATVGTD